MEIRLLNQDLCDMNQKLLIYVTFNASFVEINLEINVIGVSQTLSDLET